MVSRLSGMNSHQAFILPQRSLSVPKSAIWGGNNFRGYLVFVLKTSTNYPFISGPKIIAIGSVEKK